MSGGSFDYAFTKVSQFSEELDLKLRNREKKDTYGQKLYDFEPQVLAKLKEISKLARKMASLMREVEWLYSGDTSEDSFLEEVKKIELGK